MATVSKANPAISSLVLLAGASLAFSAGAAKDPLLAALEQGDLPAAYRNILFVEDGSKVAPVFAQASKQGATDPVLKARLAKVAFAFDRRLRKEMGPSTFAAYRKLAVDSNLGEKDRMRLILPMIEGVSRLGAAQKDTLRAFLKKRLAAESSSQMKAEILAGISSPAFAMEFQDLRPFCRSSEPSIREAAYRSLCRIVARHREKGEAQANRMVFDSLKGDAAHPPGLPEVYALTAIGEDYARDYLAAACASDPAKLKAILTHDPDLKHVGLVKAALAIPKDTPAGADIRAALKYGLKEPAWVAGQLASGPPADSSLAKELRQIMDVQTAAR